MSFPHSLFPPRPISLFALLYFRLTLNSPCSYAGSCLLLLSPRFELEPSLRSKYTDQLFTVAAPKVLERTTKPLARDVVGIELSQPHCSQIFVGETLSTQCTVHSSLPKPFTADRVVAHLVSEDGNTFELQTTGVIIPPGDSTFLLSATATLGGTFRLESMFIEVVRLCLTQAADKAAAISVVVRFVPATLTFDLNFPAWLPVAPDATAKVLLPVLLHTNSDVISSLTLSVTSPTAGFAPPPGTQIPCTVRSGTETTTRELSMGDAGCVVNDLVAGQQVVLSLPVDSRRSAVVNDVSVKVEFSTPLIGKYAATKSRQISFGQPFVISSWQSPFGVAGAVVQIVARCTARVPLRVKRFRLTTQKDPVRQFPRPLFAGDAAGDNPDALLHPDNELSVAFVVDVAPDLPELWKVFVDYSFASFDPCDGSEIVVERSHAAEVVVGSRRPQFALEVEHPSQVTVGRTFPLHFTIRRLLPAAPKEEGGKEREGPEEAQLQVRAADPRFWAIQGFKTKTVALPADVGGISEMHSLKLVALQPGHLPLPSLTITGGCVGAATAISSRTEHVTVLPEPRLYLSCQHREEASVASSASAFGSGDETASGDLIVCWIGENTQLATQSIQALHDKFKSTPHVHASARHFRSLAKFSEWIAVQPHGIERRLRIVTDGYRKEDGGDDAASRVVLHARQQPQLAGVPVIVFYGDTSKVEDLARLHNVTVTRDFRKVVEVCIAPLPWQGSTAAAGGGGGVVKRPLSASACPITPSTSIGFEMPSSPAYHPPRPPI